LVCRTLLFTPYFVYYAQSPAPDTKAVLAVMARKLYRFVTPFMFLAIALGLWRLSFQWEYYLTSGWMIAKTDRRGMLNCLPSPNRDLCGQSVSG
jgi:uncharacterized membrane protein